MMRKLLTSFYRNAIPVLGIVLQGTHCPVLYIFHFHSHHNISGWNSWSSAPWHVWILLYAAITVSMLQLGLEATLGGWQHFRGESQPSGLQIIIDLTALSFSVARTAGSSLRGVMDSTGAISSYSLFSHLSITAIYFLIYFSYYNLLVQARNRQAPPGWGCQCVLWQNTFVYADFALDCPQYDLDPSKCC